MIEGITGQKLGARRKISLIYQNTISILLLVALSCLPAFGQKSLSSKSDCEEYIFSNVRQITEIDDYVGTEIILIICSGTSEIRGSWNQYEGYHPVITDLTGTYNGKIIRLRGKNWAGKVEFTGHMENERLIGKLIIYLGTSRQENNIDLLKKKNPVRPGSGYGSSTSD